MMITQILCISKMSMKPFRVILYLRLAQDLAMRLNTDTEEEYACAVISSPFKTSEFFMFSPDLVNPLRGLNCHISHLGGEK